MPIDPMQFLIGQQSQTARVQRLLEFSPVAIVILDPSGRVISMPASFTHLFGYTQADIPHIDAWWPLAYPDPTYRATRQAVWAEEVAAALAQDGMVHSIEGHVTCKDGRQTWVEAHASFTESETFVMLVDIGKRKAAEAMASQATHEAEQQRDLNEWLKLSLAAAHAGTWEWDLKTNENRWSEEIWQLFGIDDPDLASRDDVWAQTIHPDDRAGVEHVVQDAARHGRDFHVEYRVNLGVRGERWLMSMGRCVVDVTGVPERYRGLIVDITDRARSEQVLREKEERLRLALQATHDVIWDWNIKTDLQTWSSAGEQVFGWSDIVQRPQPAQWWLSRLHPDDVGAVSAKFHLAVANLACSEWTDEYRFRCADGRYAHVVDRGYIARDANGRAIRMIGAIQDISERQEHLQALQRSEQLLQGALDNLPSHIAIIDGDGIILMVNQRWRDFARSGLWLNDRHGVGESYLAVCAAAAASGDQDAEQVAARLRDVLAGRLEHFSHEYNCPDRAGNEHWFLMNAHRFGLAQNRVLIRHTDITAQRTSEATQRLLSRAVEASGSMIMVANRQGNLVYVNPAFTRHTGYTQADALGKNPRFLQAKGKTVTSYAELWGRLLSGRTWNGQFCNRRKDGSLIWEEASLSPVLGERGEIKHFVAVKEDVTEWRRMLDELALHRDHLEELVVTRTAALQESEARFRQIADAAPVLIWMAGLDRGCFYFNRSWLEFTGRTVEQEAGNGWAEGVHPDDMERCLAIYSAGFDVRQPFSMEYRLRHASGAYRWLLDNGVPRYDERGEFLGYIGACVDIEESKQAAVLTEQARRAAEDLARVKSEFLANMSHEIRTPLNGVLGLAEIGYRDSQGRGKAQETFARILDSGKLLLTVINDILDFSKIEAGKLSVESIPIDPAQVARKALASLAERAALKGLGLCTVLAPNLTPACLGDPVRITQILINLLSNAIKFTEAGEVRLTAGFEAGELVYCVIDTGIGMTDAQVSRLFRPFEQADSSTTRQFGGTGLGLVICQRLATLMGGAINVSSQPGEGSIFSLRLPCRKTDQPLADDALAVASSRQRLTGRRILVAEDNEINQLVLEDLLRSEGAAVVLVSNGRLAVEAITQHPGGFDIVMMDVQMPEMDGLQATRAIVRLAPGLPVIGQTAHALAEEHEKCRAAGMVATVTKPLDRETVIGALLRHLKGLPQLQRAKEKPGSVTASSGQTAAAPAPVAEATLIDWPRLEAIYARRPQFILRLLQIAEASLADVPGRLFTAMADGDYADLALSAHSLKGVAGNLCADRLHLQAQAVELAAQNQSPDLAAQVEALTESVQHLHSEISAQRAVGGK